MRVWSEFRKYDDLLEHAGTFKDHGVDVGVSVDRFRLKQAEDFVKQMNSKDVDVYLWPLNGHFRHMWTDGYWVNTNTAYMTTELMKKMDGMIKSPNVKAVCLDMESMPLVEHLMNMEKSRDHLERNVEIIQKDKGTDVISMQWYWGALEKMFNLPVPRNANGNLYMVYPSMTLTRLATKSMRKSLIYDAVRDGVGKYGKIEVDVGSNHTGVYEKVLFPFCKLFTYGKEKMREDMLMAKDAGAHKVGAYTLDGVPQKQMKEWIGYMASATA